MANNVKFRENWETCTEKHVLLKMIFTKKKKKKKKKKKTQLWFKPSSLIRKDIPWWRNTD